MKIISALNSHICRLECYCCGDDHFADFFMPSKRFIEDDFYVNVNFKSPKRTLSSKLRSINSFFKNKKHSESHDQVLCTYDQVSELYSSLKLEYEQNDLLNPSDVVYKERELELTHSSDIRNHIYFLFKSKEGLTIEMCMEKSDRMIVQDINMGYIIVNKEGFLKSIKRSIDYLFGKNMYMFDEYEISLSKEEFIDFMNALNWILNKVTEIQDSKGSPFTHMEVSACK